MSDSYTGKIGKEIMLILKPSVVEKKLVFGDYVSVHVLSDKENQKRAQRRAIRDIQVQHAGFFQRIEKERKELLAA